MLDISYLRDNIEDARRSLERRGYRLDGERFQVLDARHKELKQGLQDLQTRRREYAKDVETLVLSGASAEEARAQLGDGQGGDYGARIEQQEEAVRAARADLDAFMLDIPNIPDERVPEGLDEDANQVLSTWGEPPGFDFDPKDHVGLARETMSGKLAAGLAGARFTVLRGILARLHRALVQFMLDTHAAYGYEELYLPYIANAASLRGTGQLPKFADDLFALSNASDMYLVPTAEVPLTNLYANRILDHADLEAPIRLMAHTPCFRREAGNYGRDTRGMFRQHQFDKVELVQFSRPEQADEVLDELCTHAESVLQKLELPYRKVLLCAGEMGFAARRVFDLEVWLPGQNQYREISSCSDCGTFQSRRAGLRWRNRKQGSDKVYVNTFNGSGVAVGRCLIALLENHQQSDGSVELPAALVPYMNGSSRIEFEH